jgi:hypothetical protein
MQHVIFYSWQADLPNSTNRGFIQAALEEAATTVATDLNIEPVIERDTQNVPGSPDIANTIFKKISTSHAFVADITLINPKSAKRRTPNPNVLLELGYALHALGEDRIILVMNRSYGPLEALPFDLKMRRVIPYDMPEDATERAPERKRLASILTQAMKAAIASIPQTPPAPDEVDAAITAIEAAAPNRALLIRRAMSALTKELETLAPPRFLEGATVDQLLDALHRTAPAVRAFMRLSEAIAGMNDTESARTLYKAFTPIFEHYDNQKGFEGRYDERDFDYWKFLGHELLTTLTATLLREERYETISAILEDTITIATNRRTKPVTFGYASEWLQSLEPLQKQKRRLSLHADILHDRHAHKDRDTPEDGPLADILPFDQFIAADYFLFLRGELESDEPRDRGFEWIPWTSVYLRETPDFIHSATRTPTAQRLATALGTPDVPTLKGRLLERAGRLANLWRNGFYDQPLTSEQVERIGTR